MKLPPQVPSDFEVFVNGVPQQRGRDYRVEGRVLVFDRELKKEGRLGLWRWFLGAWGIGTYRQNDSIDVRYEVGGRPQVVEGLDIDPAGV
ncbi:MAG TPA: hypothetical protein VHF89_19420 [Solirubrobacteraceae bacterium]|nr:hypothetical protein [Solirubrobacteraceae bacterium]